MLGRQINDPYHVESTKDSIQGLGPIGDWDHLCQRKADISGKGTYVRT